MADTKIEWTEKTWNPTTGCDRVSPGCDNCYAMTLAKRLKAMGSAKYQNDGDPRTSGPGFLATEHESELDAPLRWRKPAKVFVNSMSDLFHERIAGEFIAKVFAVMAVTPRHTYQVLTKRHARMRSLLSSPTFADLVELAILDLLAAGTIDGLRRALASPLPLPNVWLGVSVENQYWADRRIPKLLDTPAAVRFLSCEPLLGPIDLVGDIENPGPAIVRTGYSYPTDYGTGIEYDVDDELGVDWVIAGGESGPGARPMHPDWARSLRDQCTTAGIPFHFKQWGAWAPVGPLYGDDTQEGDDAAEDALLDAVTIEVHERRPVIQLERSGYVAEGHQPTDPRTWLMARVGKGNAGRELDGRTWDEFPAVSL